MQKLLLFFLVLYSSSLTAQKIEGTVRDTEGNVLPFASILVKGTAKGVTANNSGTFSISLPPGNYTLECRYVGYSSQERSIDLGATNKTINFILSVQRLALKEIIIKDGGEDPAYDIIRKAINKRPYYDQQVKEFEAQVYTKGLIRLLDFPDKILGRKILEEDKSQAGIDSSGKGIIYLSESVTKVSMRQPDNFKLEVISSRVSGSNGFGFDFPAFISFYKNNVNIFSTQLNPRGFISPIADGALNFYKYKFLGSFFEGGNEVNVIKVIPRRDYEPLFSGIINITENDWRIFSCDLTLTKRSQLEVLDTLRISQIHVPVDNDVWRVKSQVLHFRLDQFKVKASGNFVNVYSNYDLHPVFSKKFFDRVLIKYDTGVNKKPHSYWDNIRPVTLEPEEIKDYRIKDSAFEARKEAVERDIDSLRKKEDHIKVIQVFWSGVDHTHYGHKDNYQIHFDPLLKTLQYNTVEGLVINPSLMLSKQIRQSDTKVTFIADARYGFNNRHINPWVGFVFNSNDSFDLDKKFNRRSFFIAGGKRVSQFFKESDITGLGNSVGTLLYGRNTMKIYENYFVKTGFTKHWESGIKFLIEGEYEYRLPIENTTDFILNKKWLSRLTPNYPVEILSAQFSQHQAALVHSSISITPGQRYIQFPRSKFAVGSVFPTFTLGYTKGLKNILGSDVDYDKWAFNILGNANLRMAGSIKYNITTGGFLNNRSVFAQDYKHFYASFSHIAGEYVKSLQTSSDYQFSNASSFYTEFLFEHHSNGLLTNKIPLLKKWNWNLVEGANVIFIDPKTKYTELFVGLENIFKMIRIDVVAGFQNGSKPIYTYRIGFGGLLGDALNTQRFSRNKKIIDVW